MLTELPPAIISAGDYTVNGYIVHAEIMQQTVMTDFSSLAREPYPYSAGRLSIKDYKCPLQSISALRKGMVHVTRYIASILQLPDQYTSIRRVYYLWYTHTPDLVYTFVSMVSSDHVYQWWLF